MSFFFVSSCRPSGPSGAQSLDYKSNPQRSVLHLNDTVEIMVECCPLLLWDNSSQPFPHVMVTQRFKEKYNVDPCGISLELLFVPYYFLPSYISCDMCFSLVMFHSSFTVVFFTVILSWHLQDIMSGAVAWVFNQGQVFIFYTFMSSFMCFLW